MASIALSSVLPPMQVGMAVLAIAADVREHWVEVALLARNTRVQPSQWIPGLAVIKLGPATYRLPGSGCVTFLTRNLHRSMWTCVGWGERHLLTGPGTSDRLEQQQHRDD
jgi:hypothetical protein